MLAWSIEFYTDSVKRVYLSLTVKFPPLATGSILSPPETTVGYVGHRMSFNCAVPVGYDISWFLGDSHQRSNLLTEVPYRAATLRLDQPINPTNLTSILTINASNQTNNTLIICRASSLDGIHMTDSDGVYAIIQGTM